MIEEQIKPATTPQEMRAEIYRAAHHSPLVRNTLVMADYSGASAEDRFTVLAYHLLKENQRLSTMVLEQMRDVLPRRIADVEA